MLSLTFKFVKWKSGGLMLRIKGGPSLIKSEPSLHQSGLSTKYSTRNLMACPHSALIRAGSIVRILLWRRATTLLNALLELDV